MHVHTHQLYSLEQHNDSLKHSSANIRIKSLIMKLGPGVK